MVASWVAGFGVDRKGCAGAARSANDSVRAELKTFRFTTPDLARTRFAISPMWECMTALRALRDPARAAVHLPWVREALPVARGLDFGGALALTPPDGYMPDFLTPPPISPLACFEDEIEVLRATSEEQVVADVKELDSLPRRQGRQAGSRVHRAAP